LRQNYITLVFQKLKLTDVKVYNNQFKKEVKMEPKIAQKAPYVVDIEA